MTGMSKRSSSIHCDSGLQNPYRPSCPRSAGRRCLWLSMLETGRQRSARYPGAILCLDLDAQPELGLSVCWQEVQP